MGSSSSVSPLLDRNTFLVKEHVGILKLTDTYDILDVESQAKVGHAREAPSGLVKVLRFFVSKQLLPTSVVVTETDENGPLVFTIAKGMAFLGSTVTVSDAAGTPVGTFKQKLFSLGGGFWVYDAHGQQIAEVKGDWKGWNFTFVGNGGTQLGQVTKKWAGLGKELFTSADNYVVSLEPVMSENPTAKVLLLAAALAIDVVFKEGRS